MKSNNTFQLIINNKKFYLKFLAAAGLYVSLEGCGNATRYNSKRSDEEYQNTINAIKEWERQEKENKDNAKASRQLLQETREELAKERAKAAQGSK